MIIVRIPHLRIPHWGAILRWGILSQSVIRITHPNYCVFMHCLCMIWALGECWGHGQCVPSQYFDKQSNSRILWTLIFWQFPCICIKQLLLKEMVHITIFLDLTFSLPHHGHPHCHHRHHHIPPHHNQLQHHWPPSHLFKNWKLLTSWPQLQKSSSAVTSVILLHLKN